jgi:hypothetical protein
VLAGLHRKKFAVAAEDVAILLAEGFENALGGELGRREGAHGCGWRVELRVLF